jgi:hypothetical protein
MLQRDARRKVWMKKNFCTSRFKDRQKFSFFNEMRPRNFQRVSLRWETDLSSNTWKFDRRHETNCAQYHGSDIRFATSSQELGLPWKDGFEKTPRSFS